MNLNPTLKKALQKPKRSREPKLGQNENNEILLYFQDKGWQFYDQNLDQKPASGVGFWSCGSVVKLNGMGVYIYSPPPPGLK